MPRKIAALLVMLACTVVASTAFAHKGFFIGGGGASTSASGDLDGKNAIINSAGTEEGNLGKLNSGTGLDFDVGYMFNKYFGFEFFQTLTTHTASHQLEAKDDRAAVSTDLLGIRLTAPMSDSFDLFLRLGTAGGAVGYSKYGHEGTTTSGVFTPITNKIFTVSGSGTGYGVGGEALLGKHFGVGLGYTVFNITLDRADIGGTSGTLKHTKSETFSTGDLTFLWHM